MKNIKWKGKCKCKFDLSFAGLEQMKVKVLVNIVKKFLKKKAVQFKINNKIYAHSSIFEYNKLLNMAMIFLPFLIIRISSQRI